MLEILCELSSRQTIHMKYQALFSLKKKIRILSAVVTDTLMLYHDVLIL